MKKIIILLILTTLLLNLVSAIDYSTDTIAYWKFDGNGLEEVNGLNMSDDLAYTSGILGGQATFQTSFPYTNIASLNWAGLKTIDYWFSLNSTNIPAFTSHELNMEGDMIFIASAGYTNATHSSISLEIVDDGGGSFDCNIAIGAIPFPENQLNHHVITMNGTHLVAYMNGVEYHNGLCAADYSTAPPSSAYIRQLGDNLILLDVAYTQADVTASYNGGLGLDFLACVENWASDTNECIDKDLLISYTDLNSCGTTISLPPDNSTTTECSSIPQNASSILGLYGFILVGAIALAAIAGLRQKQGLGSTLENVGLMATGVVGVIIITAILSTI